MAHQAVGVAGGIEAGLLHLGGIALGLLAKWPARRIIGRAGGAIISAAGISFLVT